MAKCPQVVVIEDDVDIRETVCDILEIEGYTVSAYENGFEAIEGLKGCPGPCLILLDLMMPVMNGWEFLKARRDLGDTIVAIPVYIVSAVANPSDVNDTGAKGYIKKPVDIDVLLKIVARHCQAERNVKAA